MNELVYYDEIAQSLSKAVFHAQANLDNVLDSGQEDVESQEESMEFEQEGSECAEGNELEVWEVVSHGFQELCVKLEHASELENESSGVLLCFEGGLSVETFQSEQTEQADSDNESHQSHFNYYSQPYSLIQ